MLKQRIPSPVSASEAKNSFGAILARVVDGGEEVVVERQGRPRAVIISFAEYQKVQEPREQERRRGMWEQLEVLRKSVSERNADMSDEEIEASAQEVRDEAISALIARQGITFVD